MTESRFTVRIKPSSGTGIDFGVGRSYPTLGEAITWLRTLPEPMQARAFIVEREREYPFSTIRRFDANGKEG